MWENSSECCVAEELSSIQPCVLTLFREHPGFGKRYASDRAVLGPGLSTVAPAGLARARAGEDYELAGPCSALPTSAVELSGS